jgi:hypothetical protein
LRLAGRREVDVTLVSLTNKIDKNDLRLLKERDINGRIDTGSIEKIAI